MSTWLVTGGAGYIGAHVVRAFREVGTDVVVVDDLSSGHEEFVPDDVPFVRASILDEPAVTAAMTEHRVVGVVHLAGFKYAGVSVQRPLHTYEQNVTGTARVLSAMRAAGVPSIVFSSSAAVYGTPETEHVIEKTPTMPESPYGESKLVGEWLIRDLARATADSATPLRCTALRYFNVVGSGYVDIEDTSPHNLFPLVLDALQEGRTPRIYGTDYPTPDGTCVRDYVGVAALARAHVAAAAALESGLPLEPVYNLGSGDGISVRQIMDAVAEVTGIAFEPELAPRRPGDPARIVADGSLAARDLDWTMNHDVRELVRTAWAARRARDSR
ncbi:UDP-glucose 4-epimerase GalE [Cellulomonas composti]|uniref:UDP-glucose 4-epimerase n=1 Tax=Cellulomonas composti TaxID=266130 RepID=A0A511JA18_9CELL|nr:UDP-glucose 4-epimerase GalE [Cellulomonas composti]GEL94609.1 UDP-glucose 4-epimerase GalE [Cellulomonas composti]